MRDRRRCEHLITPDWRNAAEEAKANGRSQSQWIMGVLGEKIADDSVDRVSFTKRPGAAHGQGHDPGLKHQADVHDRDMSQIKNRPEMRLPQLLRLIMTKDRHRHERRANPGSAHHKLELIGVTLRANVQLLSQRNWIAAEAALCVAQRHSGFDAE